MWAISKVSKVWENDFVPNVIVTDQEQALMDVIQQVFSLSTNILCIWNINKKILPTARRTMKSRRPLMLSCKEGAYIFYKSIRLREAAFEPRKDDFRKAGSAQLRYKDMACLAKHFVKARALKH